MRRYVYVAAAACFLSAAGVAASAEPPQQGKGQGGGQEKARQGGQGGERRGGQGQGRAQERGGGRSETARSSGRGGGSDRAETARGRGRGSSDDSPGRGGSAEARGRSDDRSGGRGRGSDDRPSAARRGGPGDRLVEGVLSRGRSSGRDVSIFDVRRDGDRVRVLNRRNELLVDLDDRRDLGVWRMNRVDTRTREGAPAFCRSGAGHPVWGRQWCLDKGFGLGSRAGVSWSRTSIGDVIFGRRRTYDPLDRGGLLDVLGDVVVGRLALQAIALGLDAPLTGYWVAEPSGPALLRVRSGDYEVAEFYDYDRNDRPESLYVVVPLF